MKLIFAQGNPGTRYEKTRHNVGFLAVDFFARLHSLEFQSKSKFNADIAEFTHNGEKILVVKPMTFYNETGVSARAIVDFYKIATEDILVIHDELALPFGKIRIRHSGSDAGNNGIKSLNAHLGQSYGRIRIGIQNSNNEHIQDVDFVLATFSNDEFVFLKQTIFQETARLLDRFATESLADDSISFEK